MNTSRKINSFRKSARIKKAAEKVQHFKINGTLKEFQALIDNAKLIPQSYGVKMAYGSFGRPSGIWLECTGCPRNDVIKGSGPSDSPWAFAPLEAAVIVFKRGGWTGDGPKMRNPKCPKCSKKSA